LNIGTSGPIEVGAARDGEPGAQSILGDWRDVSLWWRRTPDVAKVLVGLVTIIGTIVAIINRVGGADPEPTAIPILTIGIELGEPTLQERGAAVLTEGADPAAVLTMNVSGLIRGPDGQGVELTWQMVNASDLRIIDLGDVWVPGPEYRLAAVTSQGTGEGEQWSQSFNVPLPLRGTCVLVRVSAYDEDGTMLQFVDSEPIDTHHPDNRLCATAATTGQSRSFVGGILP